MEAEPIDPELDDAELYIEAIMEIERNQQERPDDGHNEDPFCRDDDEVIDESMEPPITPEPRRIVLACQPEQGCSFELVDVERMIDDDLEVSYTRRFPLSEVSWSTWLRMRSIRKNLLAEIADFTERLKEETPPTPDNEDTFNSTKFLCQIESTSDTVSIARKMYRMTPENRLKLVETWFGDERLDRSGLLDALETDLLAFSMIRHGDSTRLPLLASVSLLTTKQFFDKLVRKMAEARYTMIYDQIVHLLAGICEGAAVGSRMRLEEVHIQAEQVVKMLRTSWIDAGLSLQEAKDTFSIKWIVDALIS